MRFRSCLVFPDFREQSNNTRCSCYQFTPSTLLIKDIYYKKKDSVDLGPMSFVIKKIINRDCCFHTVAFQTLKYRKSKLEKFMKSLIRRYGSRASLSTEFFNIFEEEFSKSL